MPVRAFQLSDVEDVGRLHREVGWRSRSLDGWRWLQANPALADHDAPLGWVVADEGDRAAAFVGNLIQRFRHGDRDLFGATGFNLVVPPAHRGTSRLLLKAFISQPGLFAAFTLNANPLSAPLYPRFGMAPWPATHALKLSWIVDPAACAEGRLWRAATRAAPGLGKRLGERLMNPRLQSRPRLSLPPGVAELTDFSDRSRLADFWAALEGEGRLVVDRSPAALRWRLSDPDMRRPPIALTFNRGRRITGLTIAALGKGAAIDPPMLEILDLVALEGEDGAAPALVETLIANARALGAAKVRLPVVSPRLMAQLGALGERARVEGGWGHCHVKFGDGADPDLWSPTALDGDYALCLREPPERIRSGAAPSARRGSRSAEPRSGSARRAAPDRPPADAAGC